MKAKIKAKHQILALLNERQRMRMQAIMQRIEERMAARYKNCQDDE